MKFFYCGNLHIALLLAFFFLPALYSLRDPSILVSPTIIPSFPQAVGHQVPNGFGPKLLRTTRIYKTFADCPCLANLPRQCPPCTNAPTPEIYQSIIAMQQCECAPKMHCEPCPKLYEAIHEMSLRQVIFLSFWEFAGKSNKFIMISDYFRIFTCFRPISK